MALATARGQDLDAEPAGDEDGYWLRVEAKAPPLFAAAFELGALLGGGAPEAVAALGRLGAVVGRYVQVSDDLADALKTPASADWSRASGNLALLYALTVEHPERAAFLALAACAGEPAALAEAQEILVRSGAVAYCLHCLADLAEEARSALAAAPLATPEPVAEILAVQQRSLARLLAGTGTDLTAARGAR
jgi:geranylgeranyl pyrophosphate synthase